MNTITVIFKDPAQNNFAIEDVDRNITIGNLRELFKLKGGNEADSQWKIDGEPIDDNGKKLSDFIKKPIRKITISTVAPIRGG